MGHNHLGDVVNTMMGYDIIFNIELNHNQTKHNQIDVVWLVWSKSGLGGFWFGKLKVLVQAF